MPATTAALPDGLTDGNAAVVGKKSRTDASSKRFKAYRCRDCSRHHLYRFEYRFEEAVTCYDKALDITPDFALARDNRGIAIRQAASGNAGTAVTRARLLGARGADFMRQGRFAEALAAFDEALGIEPNVIEAISNRATALFELSHAEDAVAGFDRALELDPSHAISWNNRGNALCALGRFEDALASYDKALEIQPGLAQAEENRANALFDLKRL